MLGTSDATVLWISLLAQSIGIASVLGARILEPSRSRTLAQAVFLLALLVVGGVTTLALGSGSGSWLTSGATLSVMVVGATIDLGGRSQVASL